MSSGLDIKIPQEQMQNFLGEAILRTFDTQTQEALVKEAIRHLITPPKSSGYGVTLSPLQQAFNNAVDNYARTYVVKWLEENAEARNAFEQVITDGYKKWLASDKEKLTTAIADKISQAIAKEY